MMELAWNIFLAANTFFWGLVGLTLFVGMCVLAPIYIVIGIYKAVQKWRATA